MATYDELEQQINELKSRTGRASISPEETFGVMDDLLEKLKGVDRNAASMSVQKTYISYAYMEADTNPVGDTGKPLKDGQLVAISNDEDISENALYRWLNPGWEKAGTLGDLRGYAKTGGSEKTVKEVEDEIVQLAGESFDLFSIIGSYISKFTGAVVASATRKRTDYLPISLSNDLIVTGYDGANSEMDGVALVYFYDRRRNPLGRFNSGQYGRVNKVLISKDYITDNYPSAAYVIASASTGQDDAIIIGIRPNAIKSDYDALIGDVELKNLLINNNTIGLRQEVSFNSTTGLPTVVRYYNSNNQLARQDTITYSDIEITEVRVATLVNPNVSITLTTNLETYKTEVAWN